MHFKIKVAHTMCWLSALAANAHAHAQAPVVTWGGLTLKGILFNLMGDATSGRACSRVHMSLHPTTNAPLFVRPPLRQRVHCALASTDAR
jgi:hypothetical protein